MRIESSSSTKLNDGEGYAYDYKKTVLVSGKRPQLIIEHSLKNTGRRVIDTSVYNHDFYVMDGQPTGPHFRVQFAFAPKASESLKGLAETKNNSIVFAREVPVGESVFSPITGFGSAPAENDIRVENSTTGTGVRETGDRPLSQMNFWSIRTTVCPEAYVKVHIEPGKTFKWRIVYEFYLTGTKTNETGEGTW